LGVGPGRYLAERAQLRSTVSGVSCQVIPEEQPEKPEKLEKRLVCMSSRSSRASRVVASRGGLGRVGSVTNPGPLIPIASHCGFPGPVTV